MEVRKGEYVHYKGMLYEVIGEGVHTETREEMVIYKMLYETEDFPHGSIWVRPKKMFLEDIEVDGERIPRFKYVGK